MNYTTPSLPATWLLNNSLATKGTIYADLGSQPKVFSASENVINYLFNNTETGDPNVPTRLALNVIGLPSTTTGSIYLENSFMTIILTASDTPNTNQFFNNGLGITAADRSVRAESIAFELRNNLSFNQYYNIYAQGAQVFIIARSVGSKYNFNSVSLGTNLILLGGISVSTNINSQDFYNYQNLIDYSAFVEVYVAEGTYGQTINKRNSILTDIYSITPYVSEGFAINVSDSIKQYVDVVLPTKRSTPVLVVKQLDYQIDNSGNPILPVVRPYYITWGYERRFAVGLEKKKTITGVSDVKYVINGALGLLEDYNLTPYLLDTTTTTPVKFLSSAPYNKETDYNSHEYLHFYRKSNAFELGQFGVEVEYIFYDGTSVTQSYALGNYVGIIGTLSVDISPNVLQLNSIEAINAKQIDFYKVKLYWTISSTARFYSEEKKFTMKRICNTLSNNVIFLNEFGVFDAINFTGQVEKTVSRDVQYLQRAIGISTPNTGFTTVSDEIQVPINLSVSDSFTITTELVSKDIYNWISRILNSSAVFIWSQSDNRYRAIKIDDYDYNYNTINDQSVFSLTYSFTVNNNTISR